MTGILCFGIYAEILIILFGIPAIERRHMTDAELIAELDD